MSMVKMGKNGEVKRFWMFDDGSARDVTHGYGEIIEDFHSYYHELEKDGWKEIPVEYTINFNFSFSLLSFCNVYVV